MKKKIICSLVAGLFSFGALASVGTAIAMEKTHEVPTAVAAADDYEVINTNVTGVRVHYSQWLMFTLDTFSGNATTEIVIEKNIADFNFKDNIYLNNDPSNKPSVQDNTVIYGINGNSDFGFLITTGLESSIASITIPAGTEFPSYATSKDNEKVKYVTTKDVTFYNLVGDVGVTVFDSEDTVNFEDVEVLDFARNKPNALWPAFKLSTHDYGTEVNSTVYSPTSIYTFLKNYNKVSLTSFDGKVYKFFDEMVNSFFVNYSSNCLDYMSFATSHGEWDNLTAYNLIYIPKGTVFPSHQWCSVYNQHVNRTLYRTTYDTIFYFSDSYGNEYVRVVPEFEDNSITSISGLASFEQGGAQFTNFCFEVNNFNISKASSNFLVGSALSNVVSAEYYAADGSQIHLTNDSGIVEYIYGAQFVDFVTGNNYLSQIKTDKLNNCEKVVFKEGAMFPSPKALKGESNVWYRLPEDQTFHKHNGDFVEVTTLKIGDNDPIDVFKGDKVGTLPAIPPHEVDPLGHTTYTGQWVDQNDNVVTADTIINGPLVLTAKYIESDTNYKVTFKNDDTELTSLGMNVAWTAKGVELPAVPSVKGYTGTWSSDDVTISENKFDMIDKDIVINANYTANSYKLSFGGDIADIDVTFDVAIGTLPAVPEKVGHHNGVWTIDDKEITAETVWTFDENKTAIAKYELDQFDVTFKFNNGEDDFAVKVDYGSKVELPTTPTKENAHFDAWYEDEQFTSKFNENTEIIKNTTLFAKYINCAPSTPVYSEPSEDHKMTGTLMCSVGQEVLAEETVTGTFVVDTEPGCETTGLGHYLFDFTEEGLEDQIIENIVIPAKGHGNPVPYAGLAKTCTTDGYNAYFGCDSCNVYFEDENLTIKIDNLDEWKLNEGKIPASHNLVKQDGKASTCKDHGWNHYYKCSDCGALFEDIEASRPITNLDEWKIGDGQLQLDPNNHTNLEEHAAKIPTCAEDGNFKYYYCADCNKYFKNVDDNLVEVSKEDIVIPKLDDHDYVFVEEVPATENSDGVKEHYECNECGRLFILTNGNYVEVSQEDLKISYVSPKPETESEDKKSGCKGSIIGASALITISSLASVILLANKKKKEY